MFRLQTYSFVDIPPLTDLKKVSYKRYICLEIHCLLCQVKYAHICPICDAHICSTKLSPAVQSARSQLVLEVMILQRSITCTGVDLSKILVGQTQIFGGKCGKN